MFRLLNIESKKIFFNIHNLQFFVLYPFLILLLYLSIISTILGTFILNLNLIVFNLIFIIFYIKNFNKLKLDINLNFFLIIIAIFFINIYFSNQTLYSFKTFLGLIKNFIFLIGSYVILKINNKMFNYFINLIFIIFILVACDTLLQFYSGKDIFGYTKPLVSYGRLSGPFGDELVVGSFLSKILFISILFFLINFKNKLYDLIFIVVSIFIIFLTKERSASIMSFLTMIIYIFLRIKNLKFRMAAITSMILILYLSITFIPNVKDRFQVIYNKNYTFLDTQWGAHFLTSFEIFKKYPIFGSGLRTFRFECGKDYTQSIPSKAKNIRCSTHPHNYYFEILSDLGVSGLVMFLYFLYKLSCTILNSFRRSSAGDNIIVSVSLFFLFFWPLKTTGSIFSSWNSYFYILSLIIIFYQTNFIKYKDK